MNNYLYTIYFRNEYSEKAIQKGLLLVHTGRKLIKAGPSLTIPDGALEEELNVIDGGHCEVIQVTK
jgi:4-aminobutyrate aminotransferase/diaminobutyrate-pyruvate transaminase/4-aminobutyrate aminotransferase/(S)-3-amino-2-methylpropionate transaminase